MSIPFQVDIFNIKNFITHTRELESIYQAWDDQCIEMRNAAIHPHAHKYSVNGMQIKFQYKLSLSSWWVHSILQISRNIHSIG